MNSTKTKAFGCPNCRQLGYVLDIKNSNHLVTKLDLCSCSQKLCQCANQSPFYYISGDKGRSQLVPCAIYPLHRKISLIENIYQQAQLPRKYKFRFYNQHFDSRPYDGTKFASTVNNLIPIVWEKGQSIEEAGFFFTGQAGSGKTFLAAIILNELIFRHAIASIYLKTTRTLTKIRETFNTESHSYGQSATLLKQYREIPALIIDDLGAQKDSDWTDEILYDIIDSRYEENRFTIITSNLSVEKFEELGATRIASRIREMCTIVNFPNMDYRVMIQQQRQVNSRKKH